MKEPTEFVCPGCGKQLRVPAEALGKRVRCPACDQVVSLPASFTAKPPPLPRETGSVPPRRREEEDERPPPRRRSYDDDEDDDRYDEYDRPRRHRRAPYRGSGLALVGAFTLILGILGLGFNVFGVLSALYDLDEADPELPDFLNEILQNSTGPVAAATQAVFAVLCVFLILGGIQMLRRKSYHLCLAASILSLLNFGNFCCLFSLPVGIWGLVLLNDPAVKESFDIDDQAR